MMSEAVEGKKWSGGVTLEDTLFQSQK